MLLARFWELLAGSLLAYYLILVKTTNSENPNSQFSNLPFVGLLLILYAFLFVDFDSHHPGVITLIPVVGSVLIIWFASEKSLITQLLSTKIFVAVGLLSYSLYLWHYPIFAFGRILNPVPDVSEKALWIVLTLALSICSYFLIEKPARNKEILNTNVFYISIIIAGITILTIVTLFSKYSTESPKISQLKTIYGKNEPDNAKNRAKSLQILEDINLKLTGQKRNVKIGDPSSSEARSLWFSDKSNKKILIVGDSHSKDLFNAFELNKELFTSLEFARYGIRIVDKNEEWKQLTSSPNFQRADIIILAPRYGARREKDNKRLYEYQLRALPGVIRELKKTGKKIIVAGNTAEFLPFNGHEAIFDGYMMKHHEVFDSNQLKKLFYQNRDPSIQKINIAVEDIAKEEDVDYLDRYSLLCDDSEEICHGITSDGFKTFYDYGHTTLEGAKFLGKQIIDNKSWTTSLF